MPLLRRAQANSTQSSSRLSKREEHRIHIQAYIMFRSHNEKAGSQLCEEEASFCFILLVSGENPEHFNLCAYYSAFLTKSSSWGLAQSLEETKDHRRGCKPPVGLRQQKKPRRVGCSKLNSNTRQFYKDISQLISVIHDKNSLVVHQYEHFRGYCCLSMS